MGGIVVREQSIICYPFIPTALASCTPIRALLGASLKFCFSVFTVPLKGNRNCSAFPFIPFYLVVPFCVTLGKLSL